MIAPSRLGVVAGALVCGAAGSAAATYSIAGVDRASGQVGGAGASCIGKSSVRIIYGAAPGKGVVHAQALINTDGRDEAVSLLLRDRSPADIIARLSSPEFDPDASRRQYGVVDLAGRAAGFTGDDNGDFAGDRQGESGSFIYTVQGNILTGPVVIDRAAAAFAGGGCDLADRLMLALEAGAEDGEGDSRCTDDGVPADSAFIEVDLPGAEPGSYLRIEVTGTGTTSPVLLLRAEFDAWRGDHPCPSAADAGPEPEPEPDAAPERGDASPGGGGGATEVDESGCGCGAGSGSPGLAQILLAAVALMAARSAASGTSRGRSRPGARPCRRSTPGGP
jgi:uncharacterized Ntn-hydrolase superfamily protein